jgi:DNA-directed RNA polymerase subunit RPC12/RpoP
MKITKYGDLNRANPFWDAACSKCGCEMEARQDELTNIETDAKGDSWAPYSCMTCGGKVFFRKRKRIGEK